MTTDHLRRLRSLKLTRRCSNLEQNPWTAAEYVDPVA